LRDDFIEVSFLLKPGIEIGTGNGLSNEGGNMDQRMSLSDLYERGLVFKRARMFEQAIDDFRLAAQEPQYTGRAYVQMALCLKAINRHDDAVMAFRQASASPTIDSDEQLHIFYHMGRTLESAGRYAESLEVYGWIRKEHPKFGDVARRIKHLCAGGRGAVPQAVGSWQGWMETMIRRSEVLKPLMAIVEQTGQWLGRQTGTVPSLPPAHQSNRTRGRNPVVPHARSSEATNRRTQTVSKKRTLEHRRYVRVPVRLHSYFSVKGRTVAGKGELRDLSPWGCRVTSAVAVPVGTDVQCCIFPLNSSDAFVIEGATVRWISPKEFGLAFTNVSPVVRQRIVQMCRVAA
jgi:hypothetical protein